MVRVIVDSACDLEHEVTQALGVEVLPLTVFINETEYKDRVDLPLADFYKMLEEPKVVAKTGQVTPGAFIAAFEKALAQGDDEVLSISFSSKLSGTYQASVVAKETVGSDRVHVFDTKAASMGAGLIVMEVGRMAKEGASLQECMKVLQEMSSRMEHIFAVGSLEMLKRGGRISAAKAAMGSLLNVKPILQFEDGAIVPLDKVRGTSKMIKRLLDEAKTRGKDLANQKLGISHANCPEYAEQLAQMLRAEFGVKEIAVTQIGSVIGAHVGSGTVALFFQH